MLDETPGAGAKGGTREGPTSRFLGSSMLQAAESSCARGGLSGTAVASSSSSGADGVLTALLSRNHLINFFLRKANLVQELRFSISMHGFSGLSILQIAIPGARY